MQPTPELPQLTAQELGRALAAYQRYGAVTDFKNHRGEPMPTFEQLPPTIVRAWVAAATPVLPGLVLFESLSAFEQHEAGRAVWQALTTAAGSEQIGIGWAGMSVAEAIQNHTSGVLSYGPHGYTIAPADLQRLLVMVEHPPTKEDYSGSNDDEAY